MQSSGDHRPEPDFSGPPVKMTGEFIDFLRATLLWKLDGLSDEEVRRPLTPSGVSLIALVKHSAWVERHWFQVQFAGHDLEIIWSAADPDADWRIEEGETVESIIAFYRQETERSRAIYRDAAWDEICAGEKSRSLGRTLGWVMTHMVEEVARHCGHADILRESLDGATGE